MKKFILILSLISTVFFTPLHAQALTAPSEMIDLVAAYQEDVATLSRKYPIRESMEYYNRFEQLHADWRKTLKDVSFNTLSQNGKIDYIMLVNSIERDSNTLSKNRQDYEQIKGALKFGDKILPLLVQGRRGDALDGQKTAAVFNELKKDVKTLQQELEKQAKYPERLSNKVVAGVNGYRTAIKDFYRFYNEYDPQFTWWMKQPYSELDTTIAMYSKFLKNWKTADAGKDDGSGIIGNPIGRDEIIRSLGFEMIAYTPEELIEIANAEFAWCEKEMLKASAEMGFKDKWKDALEKVKTDYVDVGKQPELAKFLADEATEYVEKNNLVTVPALAKEVWRMRMLSAEMQRFAPFFLGGEVLQIAYPTMTMSEEDKMMSIRGNNKHFSRAVVHHELIPGHHLQGFMNDRYNPHRQYFRTPFSVEGWALYWEMVLWDRNFPKSPENKVGMLFWRMHRCARIIFSLNYHMNKWTPQQCIDFLVDKVGHERANAAAEVRRSFTGGYGPLYQIAYMIGAKEYYALRKELGETGKMKEKDYNDAILKNGPIPVEMLRALLTNQKLDTNFKTSWKFK